MELRQSVGEALGDPDVVCVVVLLKLLLSVIEVVGVSEVDCVALSDTEALGVLLEQWLTVPLAHSVSVTDEEGLGARDPLRVPLTQCDTEEETVVEGLPELLTDRLPVWLLQALALVVPLKHRVTLPVVDWLGDCEIL